MVSIKSQDNPRSWSDWLEFERNQIERLTLARNIVTLDAGPRVHLTHQGRPYVLFTSNDYLGLGLDPRVGEAASDAIVKYGSSVSASRLLFGSTPLHDELEGQLANFKKSAACLLFSSGYLANLGVLSTLASKGDAIFSDRLNHASIIDGCRLSPASTLTYPHRDMSALEDLLKTHSGGRKLIVSETVFSMDGDMAPLPDLVKLADRYEALLILDEAHATGVVGASGAGAMESFHLRSERAIIVGTLSKALGSLGGFVCGDSRIIDHLRNRCRTFIFDTALSPGNVAASLKALEISITESWRRDHVTHLAELFRSGLARLGLPPTGSVTPILPFVAGDSQTAIDIEHTLWDEGFLARAIRPPTVPRGQSRIRFTVSAAHTESDVEAVVAALAQMRCG